MIPRSKHRDGIRSKAFWLIVSQELGRQNWRPPRASAFANWMLTRWKLHPLPVSRSVGLSFRRTRVEGRWPLDFHLHFHQESKPHISLAAAVFHNLRILGARLGGEERAFRRECARGLGELSRHFFDSYGTAIPTGFVLARQSFAGAGEWVRHSARLIERGLGRVYGEEMIERALTRVGSALTVACSETTEAGWAREQFGLWSRGGWLRRQFATWGDVDAGSRGPAPNPTYHQQGGSEAWRLWMKLVPGEAAPFRLSKDGFPDLLEGRNRLRRTLRLSAGPLQVLRSLNTAEGEKLRVSLSPEWLFCSLRPLRRRTGTHLEPRPLFAAGLPARMDFLDSERPNPLQPKPTSLVYAKTEGPGMKGVASALENLKNSLGQIRVAAPAVAPAVDVPYLTRQVYDQLERELRIERERRGR